MAMYSNMDSPLDRAMQGQQPTPGSVQTGPVPDQNHPASGLQKFASGALLFDGFGEGNALTGNFMAGTFGPSASQGGALGWEYGKKADNPWEAFTAGGQGANENIYNNPMMTAVSPNPVDNYLAGGLSGVAGNIGIPGVSVFG